MTHSSFHTVTYIENKILSYENTLENVCMYKRSSFIIIQTDPYNNLNYYILHTYKSFINHMVAKQFLLNAVYRQRIKKKIFAFYIPLVVSLYHICRISWQKHQTK